MIKWILLLYILPIVITLVLVYKYLPRGSTIGTCIKMLRNNDLPALWELLIPIYNILIMFVWVIVVIDDIIEKHKDIRIK